MKATESPEKRRYYLDRANKALSGEIELHACHTRPKGIHLSDCTTFLHICPLKPYYHTLLSELPPLDDTTIMKFALGRGFELYFGSEQPPIQVEGIWMTFDDICAVDDTGTELKFTDKSMKNFDPLNTYPEWTCRIMGYCHGKEDNKWNLGVLFNRGNYKDIQKEFKVWEILFDAYDLHMNWGDIEFARDEILEQVGPDYPIKQYFQVVADRKASWACGYCSFPPMCYYYNEYEGK